MLLNIMYLPSDNAEKDYIGFDWLTAIVYLIMCSSHGAQSHDMTWQFMKDFSQLLVSGYLWMPRLHLSVSVDTNACINLLMTNTM